MNLRALLGLLSVASMLAAPALGASSLEGSTARQFLLGGSAVDWAPVCNRAGACEIWFLVAPPSSEEATAAASEAGEGELEARAAADSVDETDAEPPDRRLLVLRPGAQQLEVLATHLHHELRHLLPLDLNGDGSPEPLLVAPNRIEHAGLFESRPFLILPRLVGSKMRALVDPRTPLLPVLQVGRLLLYDVASGGPRLVADLPLPVEVARRSTTLEVSTPEIHRVEGVPITFAVGPQQHGPQRWRMTLIEQLKGGGFEARVVHQHTPMPERPLDAKVVRLGGHIYLVSSALQADKLAMLERKKVRVYPLRDDRTRVGTRPIFEAFTVSRHWQDLGMQLRNIDSDANPELVLLQREGFNGKKLQIDVYQAQQSDGPLTGFASKPARTMIHVPWAEWTLTRDLTGDGRDDLLLNSGDLYLMPGLEPRNKKTDAPAFADEADWRLRLPEAKGPDPMVTVDLGDDGEMEEEIGDEIEARDEDRPQGTVHWGPVAVVDQPGDVVELVSVGGDGTGDRVWVLRLGG